MARSASALKARKLRRLRIRVRPHSGEISVYRKGSRLSGAAPTVSLEVAQEWVNLGWAEPVNRGTGIQLRLSALDLRGISCRLGPHMIELAAYGVFAALAAAESYRNSYKINTLEAGLYASV